MYSYRVESGDTEPSLCNYPQALYPKRNLTVRCLFLNHFYNHRSINELEIKLSKAKHESWFLCLPSPEVSSHNDYGPRMLIHFPRWTHKRKRQCSSKPGHPQWAQGPRSEWLLQTWEHWTILGAFQRNVENENIVPGKWKEGMPCLHF